MFSVTEKCGDCDGESIVVIGDPIDPSARLVDCGWCYNGTVTYEVEGYGSVDDVREDYPKAIRIEETKNV